MKDNEFFLNLEGMVRESCQIENELFDRFDVKRGLRNNDRTGVLVGLTNIGDVAGYEKSGDRVVAVPGKLLYRGAVYTAICNGKNCRLVRSPDGRAYFFCKKDCKNCIQVCIFKERLYSDR
jgi:hypothetical protein